MSFKKILVVEDTDSNNKGIMTLLNEMGIDEINQSQFCDDAFLKIKKAISDKHPYQLLISDLSFKPSPSTNKIRSGQELIRKIKAIQPFIKVIVFSVEDKPSILKSLMDNQNIDGYVCKGLYGLRELKKAIQEVNENKKYTCPVSTGALKQKNFLQLSEYEKLLLELIAKGYKHEEVSTYLKTQNITPYSKRSIEDHLSKLRDHFNASTTSQLIYLASIGGFIDESTQ